MSSWVRPRRCARRRPSHQAATKPTTYIRPYQWIANGPRLMATGSIAGYCNMSFSSRSPPGWPTTSEASPASAHADRRHHPQLLVLDDVAVEQPVAGLAEHHAKLQPLVGRQVDGVLPGQPGRLAPLAVAIAGGDHLEVGAMHMEGMVHVGVVEDLPLLHLAGPALEEDLVHGEGTAVDQEIHLRAGIAALAGPVARMAGARAMSAMVTAAAATVGGMAGARTMGAMMAAAAAAVGGMGVTVARAVVVMARHHLGQLHPTLHRRLAQGLDAPQPLGQCDGGVYARIESMDRQQRRDLFQVGWPLAHPAALVGMAGQLEAPLGLLAHPHQQVGALARGEQQLLQRLRPLDQAAIGTDQGEFVLVQAQTQVAPGAGIDQPQ